MNAAPQGAEHRGMKLLAAHLESLDPGAFTARERLAVQLGSELARRLVSALAARPPYRPAACRAA
jgi:hypothetical protein